MAMSIKNFRSEKGSAVVEFAFYIFIFTLICGVLMDMTFSLIKKSELERVNNSLMSVLRERNAFYDGRAIPSALDFNQIKEVANTLLGTTDKSYQLELRIALPASGPVPDPDVRPSFAEAVFNTQKINGCEIDENVSNITQLGSLSVFGQPPGSADPNGIWYPVYELTICMPGAVSYFNQFMGVFNKKLASLYIKNVAIPRL
ncbi:hypothetical protein JGC56_01165 [Salmonella enterica subsp. enterica serovar Saintpaul]|nr:hypothetical protein [Salmonella enterica subsp. enterica serovar Saintpaul]